MVDETLDRSTQQHRVDILLEVGSLIFLESRFLLFHKPVTTYARLARSSDLVATFVFNSVIVIEESTGNLTNLAKF